MDQQTLIEQCSLGNREAMTELYLRYSSRMLRLILRYISDRNTAEDILHDGFVVIFTHISEIKNPDKLEFWMGTIMKNLALRYLSDLEITSILEEPDDMIESPDISEILSYEELELIINKLPTGYRTIFKLAVLENKSHTEIGKILGIAPHSSSSQLSRAKAMLRKLIEERNASLLLLMCLLIPSIIYLFFNKTKFDILDQSSLTATTSTDIADELVGIESISDMTDRLISFNQIKRLIKSNTTPNISLAPSSGNQKQQQTINQPSVTIKTAVRSTDEVDEITTSETKNTMTETDSTNTNNRPQYQYSGISHYAHTRTRQKNRKNNNNGWSLNINYGVVPNVHNKTSQNFYSNDTFEKPCDKDSIASRSVTDNNAIRNISHSVPVTLGLTLSKQISTRLNLETGVMFTYLRSRIEYMGQAETVSKTRSYFIGIPLKLNYQAFTYGNWIIYGTAGVAMDIPVRTDIRSDNPNNSRLPHLRNRIQMSLSGGCGLELRLTPAISLYAEPSVKYYPDNHSSLPTIRQDQKFEFTLPIGLRYNL